MGELVIVWRGTEAFPLGMERVPIEDAQKTCRWIYAIIRY